MKTEAKILIKNRGYYASNRKKVLAQKKVWYAHNRNRKRTYDRAYYQANRTRLLGAQKEYYTVNLEKIRDYRKEYWTKDREKKLARRRDSNYGLASGEFERLLAAQGGRCAICKQTPKKLCVDHCHGSGKVRGLLCGKCNFAIGHLDDSSEKARAAARYLKSHGK